MDNGKILNFLYTTQSRRRMNPLYAIFTKIGIVYIIAGYILFAMMDKGMVVLIAYLSAGLYIYNNKMNYRFYHQDRLHYFHMFTEYLGKRNPVDRYDKIYNYLTKKKNLTSSLIDNDY